MNIKVYGFRLTLHPHRDTAIDSAYTGSDMIGCEFRVYEHLQEPRGFVVVGDRLWDKLEDDPCFLHTHSASTE